MKKKMKFQLMMISLFAIFMTMLASILIFSDLFLSQVREDLRNYAHLLRETGAFSVMEEGTLFNGMDGEIRVTWITGEGDVLYDNAADASHMANHLERPEIQDAILEGEGYQVRRSDTLEEDTYYLAIRLENGSILRVSKNADSIFSIIVKVCMFCVIIAAVVVLIAIIIANVMTKQFMKPLEDMVKQIDHSVVTVQGYEEIQPFLVKIRQQHEGILEASRARRDFTANVTHELKTPLTAISGYSELIESGMATGKEATNFAKNIHTNANRLLFLINDILKLSELDSLEGKETEFSEVNMEEIVTNCIEMLQLSADSYGVNVDYKGEILNITGDYGLLEELVYNLISNAIKYNNKGGHVWVTLGYKGEEKQPYLQVKDNGIGIPKESLERVFERFYRVDKSRSKERGGTGLGLAICKHIAAIHDAEIVIESEVKKGTSIQVLF